MLSSGRAPCSPVQGCLGLVVRQPASLGAFHLASSPGKQGGISGAAQSPGGMSSIKQGAASSAVGWDLHTVLAAVCLLAANARQCPRLKPTSQVPPTVLDGLQLACFPGITVPRKHRPTHCRRLRNRLEAEAAQQWDALREGTQTSQRSRSAASPEERAPAAADA